MRFWLILLNSGEKRLNGAFMSELALHNQSYQEKLAEFDAELIEAAENMEPWQVKVCGLYYQKKSIKECRVAVKKRLATVSKFLDSPEAKNLIRIRRELDAYKDGPSEAERKHWLVQIVKSNLNEDPKEARGAIVELNRMEQKDNAGGGQSLNIVINNVLQRGSLDG